MLAPTGGDLRGEIGEAARTIADHGGETAEPAVGDEAAFDHAAEHIRIDVSAAEQEDDALAGEFGQLTGETGGEGRGGGAFDDAFLQFDDAQDRERDLFLVDGTTSIDECWRAISKALLPTCGNGETVGQRRLRVDA